MNIALFGGTFDPIHSGHLRAARISADRLQLDQVLFIPSGSPPHKTRRPLTDFAHRYAMVALACAGEPRFVPSLLESPTPKGRPRYSIYTARTVERRLKKGDRLFFLIGVDAVLDLRQWRDYRSLLNLVNFIVVTRPGFDARKIWDVLPQDITDHRGRRAGMMTQSDNDGFRKVDVVRLRRTTLYLLSGVHAPIASRDIRQAIASGHPITGLVPSSVEKYITKEGLYRNSISRR